MKTAIVGNEDISAADKVSIAACKQIIRINAPPPSHMHEGMRTNRLYLVNTAKQTQVRMTDQTYLSGPVFQDTGEIILSHANEIIEKYTPKAPLHLRLLGRRVDHTEICVSVAREFGKQVTILPSSIYEQACDILGIAEMQKSELFPSTGFLAITATLAQSQVGEEIHLFGFSFRGWKRHKWEAERQFVLHGNHAALIFHPPPGF
jgi:hypothetical protein